MDLPQESSYSSVSNICNMYIQLGPRKLAIDTAQTPLSSLQPPLAQHIKEWLYCINVVNSYESYGLAATEKM